MTSFDEQYIQTFFKEYYKDEIDELTNLYPDRKTLDIDFLKLDMFSPEIAESLLSKPGFVIEELSKALQTYDALNGTKLDNTQVQVRIMHFPQVLRKKVKQIKSADTDKLVCLQGFITKITQPQPFIDEAKFECPFCHHLFSVAQRGLDFVEPYECPQEDGGCGRKVQKFILRKDLSVFTDIQKIEVQDQPEDLKGGEMPAGLVGYLGITDVNTMKAGDRVIISGILRTHQVVGVSGKKRRFNMYLEVNSIELQSEIFDELKITDKDVEEIIELSKRPEIYEWLIESIAPSVYGYHEIKEAIALQLFSGVSKVLPDGITRVRGDTHVLIIGDPGSGKSIILKYAIGLAPHGIYSSGKTSSKAGLTAAAVKDDFGEGRWTIEAGVLPQADKGLAAIDEIDKMEEEDRSVLHEALEQQTITIAKAGINMILNSRCSLLAAANPKQGRFDSYTPISEQINMPPPLLSRFDLIFSVVDKPNESNDTATAKHILKSHYAGTLRACQESGIIVKKQLYSAEELQTLQPTIPIELMRKYIAYSKQKIKPILTQEALDKFLKFYVETRKISYEEDTAIPLTARELEGLIRLGEAKARTRLSVEISEEDAEAVIKLVSFSLNTVCTDPETGSLDVDRVKIGTTKTVRDRTRSIVELMRGLEKEYGEEVPVSDLIDLAEEEGIQRDKAEEVIDRMKRDGVLYSPGGGVVKFV